MNKAELIDVVATRIDTSKKEASEAVQAVVEAITEAVAKGQKVSISGFGVFEKAERAARTYRAPSTGEAIRKVATAVPRFRPGGDFKASVSGEGNGGPGEAAVTDEAGQAAATKATSAKPAAPTTRTSPARKSTTAKATAAKKSTAARTTTAAKKSTAAKKAPVKKAPAKKSAPAAASDPVTEE